MPSFIFLLFPLLLLPSSLAFYMIRPLELEDVLALEAQREMQEDEMELASRWRALRQALLDTKDPLGKLEEGGQRAPTTVWMVPEEEEGGEDGEMLLGEELGGTTEEEGEEEEGLIWVERPRDGGPANRVFVLE